LKNTDKIVRFVKIVAINVSIGLVGIGLFVSTPIVLSQSYDLVKTIVPAIDVGVQPVVMDQRASPEKLPNYQGVEWAEQLFEDLTKTKLVDVMYLGWQSGPVETSTINISGSGLRHTVQPTIVDDEILFPNKPEYWMFGGSTMFGWGVDDAHTIPSNLASLLSARVVNFGTPSWRSFQSLIRLIGEYGLSEAALPPPRTVVFLDGANDVGRMCRVRMIGDLERGIRFEEGIDIDDSGVDTHTPTEDLFSDEKLQQPYLHKLVALSPRWLLQPALSLIKRFKDSSAVGLLQNDPDDIFICDNNPDRARFVAEQLVNDWSAAKAITEERGDRFVALLQPVKSLSQTRTDHLSKVFHEDEMAKQYEVVYPIIRELAIEIDLEFYDLTASLDRDEYFYIDFFHLSPNGTQAVAEEIATILSTPSQ